MLNRVTFGSDTLREYNALPHSQQDIIWLLLTHRNSRDKPLKPSHYFSYREIGEKLGLKKESVRVLISTLQKKEWIANIRQRKRYTASGAVEVQYSWSVIKVVAELAEVFQAEQEAAAEQQRFETATDENIFEFEGKLWRRGGNLGWECKNIDSRTRVWATTLNPPDGVIKHFS